MQGIFSILFALLSPLTQMQPTFASYATSATFVGGSGTGVVGSTIYAKAGGTHTMHAETTADTTCLNVTLGPGKETYTSSTARTSWHIPVSAGSGNGSVTATVSASPNVGSQGIYTGSTLGH